MSLTLFTAMFGKLEGAGGIFARDVAGYAGIEAGIYRRRGLDLSWLHVQGTEERYRRLESGAADVSFVVGRAALKHFLAGGATRIIGSSLNSCPYRLIAAPGVAGLKDLKGKILVYRESVVQSGPLARTFQEKAGLKIDADLTLNPVQGDQDAYEALVGGQAQAALLPRQYGFLAEEKGCKGIAGWPDVVDDPLPVSIEATEKILRDKPTELAAFLSAHGEAVRHLKTHRAETIRMLGEKFGHAPTLAEKTFDEYLVLLDDSMTIDRRHLENLLAQVAPDYPGGAGKLAGAWLAPGAARPQRGPA